MLSSSLKSMKQANCSLLCTLSSSMKNGATCWLEAGRLLPLGAHRRKYPCFSPTTETASYPLGPPQHATDPDPGGHRPIRSRAHVFPGGPVTPATAPSFPSFRALPKHEQTILSTSVEPIGTYESGLKTYHKSVTALPMQEPCDPHAGPM